MQFTATNVCSPHKYLFISWSRENMVAKTNKIRLAIHPKKKAFNAIMVCWCISASIYLSQNTYAICLLLACTQPAILKDLPILAIYLYLDQNQILWKEHCIIQILFMECITFKLEDSKNCWHVQKDIFWIFITTAGTLLNIF